MEDRRYTVRLRIHENGPGAAEHDAAMVILSDTELTESEAFVAVVRTIRENGFVLAGAGESLAVPWHAIGGVLLVTVD